MTKKTVKHRVTVNQICVNNIDTASGIFIGTNYANNWSSHRKSNHGFGTVSNSLICYNQSFVIDNDLVDTPINNNSVCFMDQWPNVIKNDVGIGEVNINVLDASSALSVGENVLNGWSSHSKRNSGQGRSVGAFQNSQNTNHVYDSDVIDAQINNYSGS
ncbi:hypothetical protein [Neobacillus sp. D3-1R]|uniref:hypothetical protein n=1 Tax=Neobacillus sp. D3-1R TaxID=3445778 RepID=UPI003FA0C149